MMKGGGDDMGIADSRGQRLERGKGAWGSSTANRAGIGSCQACSRFTTASCPFAGECQSGM